MGRPKGSKNKARRGRPIGSKNKSRKFGPEERNRQSLKTIQCSNFDTCGGEEIVDIDTVSVLCSTCVQKTVPVDVKLLEQRPTTKPKKSNFPRGWHLYKQYVHTDGRVFEKGVENPKLKGKLSATEVKKDTLLRSQRRRIRDEKKLKKENRLARQYKKKQKGKKK